MKKLLTLALTIAALTPALFSCSGTDYITYATDVVNQAAKGIEASTDRATDSVILHKAHTSIDELHLTVEEQAALYNDPEYVKATERLDKALMHAAIREAQQRTVKYDDIPPFVVDTTASKK